MKVHRTKWYLVRKESVGYSLVTDCGPFDSKTDAINYACERPERTWIVKQKYARCRFVRGNVLLSDEKYKNIQFDR